MVVMVNFWFLELLFTFTYYFTSPFYYLLPHQTYQTSRSLQLPYQCLPKEFPHYLFNQSSS